MLCYSGYCLGPECSGATDIAKMMRSATSSGHSLLKGSSGSSLFFFQPRQHFQHKCRHQEPELAPTWLIVAPGLVTLKSSMLTVCSNSLSIGPSLL